jgi:hypothetical protein
MEVVNPAVGDIREMRVIKVRITDEDVPVERHHYSIASGRIGAKILCDLFMDFEVSSRERTHSQE